MIINFQVTINGYDIDELDPSTIAVNEVDTNENTCCLGENCTVLWMTSRNANINLYNYSYKSL